MTNLEKELDILKTTILEMTIMAYQQLEKAKESFLNMNTEIAEELIHNERRMNALELIIDRICENMLAVFQPVATDLRFIIANLKINSDLERIADLAEKIALNAIAMKNHDDIKLVELLKIREMFDIAIVMLKDIEVTLEQEDSNMARTVYKKDTELNQINKAALDIINNYNTSLPIKTYLLLYTTINSLERIGDHVKNIAENIIFYIEAKIVKHKKTTHRKK